MDGENGQEKLDGTHVGECTVKTDWLKRPKKFGCLDASETTSLNWLL